MSRIPNAISDAAAEFDGIPGVGPRAALRYAFWLVTQPKERIRRFGEALLALAEGVVRCRTCGSWSDKEICAICSDTTRDRSFLCVVATDQDLRVIENSGAFKGIYHVLGGLLDPIEGRTPDVLSIPRLISRIKDTSSGIKEVILAFDPDVSGDTTTLYVARQLNGTPVTVTRPARGLQTGAQIEYADEMTVADAFANRRKQ